MDVGCNSLDSTCATFVMNQLYQLGGSGHTWMMKLMMEFKNKELKRRMSNIYSNYAKMRQQ